MRYMTVANKDTLPSREVAKMVGKDHAHLCRDIKGYIEVISENPKLDSQKYFIPNTYKVEGNNKTYPCYDITKLGCEMIANKLTGKKGILFTAEYVKRFNEMERGEATIQTIDTSKQMRAEAMLRNARVRQAKLLQELMKAAVTDSVKQILVVQAANITAGEKILDLPRSNERETITTSEICRMFNLKETWACQLGKVLKKELGQTEETGYHTQTTATHNNRKEVRQWNWYVEVVMPVVNNLEHNGLFTGHYRN